MLNTCVYVYLLSKSKRKEYKKLEGYIVVQKRNKVEIVGIIGTKLPDANGNSGTRIVKGMIASMENEITYIQSNQNIMPFLNQTNKQISYIPSRFPYFLFLSLLVPKIV